MRPVVPFLIVIALEAIVAALHGVIAHSIRDGGLFIVGTTEYAFSCMWAQTAASSRYGSVKKPSWLVLNRTQRSIIQQLFIVGVFGNVWIFTSETRLQLELSVGAIVLLMVVLAAVPFSGKPEPRVPMGMVSSEEAIQSDSTANSVVSRATFALLCILALLAAKLHLGQAIMSTRSGEALANLAPLLLFFDLMRYARREGYVQKRDIPLFIGIVGAFFAFIYTMKGSFADKLSEFWQCVPVIIIGSGVSLACIAALIKSDSAEANHTEGALLSH